MPSPEMFPQNVESPQPSQEKTIEREQSVEKRRNLYGQSFEIFRIDKGDAVPVGGKSQFRKDADLFVTADFEKLQPFFQEVTNRSQSYNHEQLASWLKRQGVRLDTDVFARLAAFTELFQKQFAPQQETAAARQEEYQKSEQMLLSKTLEDHHAECAEIAAAAQGYMQHEHISSSYFSGEVLWNRGEEFGEKHSFLVLRFSDRTLLYDPSNPTRSADAILPSLYEPQADFDDEMRQDRKRFVAARNLLSQREVFFGVNDGTNVDAEADIVPAFAQPNTSADQSVRERAVERAAREKRLTEIAIEVDEFRDALGEPVDPGIKESVVMLRAHVFPTAQSCEGHTDHGNALPYVDIEAPAPEGWRDHEDRQEAWRQMNEAEAQRLREFLNEWYAKRENEGETVPAEDRITMSPRGIYGAVRLEPTAQERLSALDQEHRALAIKPFSAEFQRFTRYLHDRYLGDSELKDTPL